MQEKLQKLKDEALLSFKSVHNIELLEELRVKYMGKKGELTNILKEMGKSQSEADQWISGFWISVNQEKDLNHILRELSILTIHS